MIATALALVGFGCVGHTTLQYRNEEDQFPQCAMIGPNDNNWSIIMTDTRTGKQWAIETDITAAQCVVEKPRDTATIKFTCGNPRS